MLYPASGDDENTEHLVHSPRLSGAAPAMLPAISPIPITSSLLTTTESLASAVYCPTAAPLVLPSLTTRAPWRPGNVGFLQRPMGNPQMTGVP